MSAFLETTVGKFTFRVDPSCLYNDEGVWVRAEGDRARLGLSDYLQRRSGDIAFVEVKPAGSILSSGEEFAGIETIKVTIALSAPLSGRITRVNPALETAPEIINQDPFGAGWLCEVEPGAWGSERAHLMDAKAYFEKMKIEANDEVNRK